MAAGAGPLEEGAQAGEAGGGEIVQAEGDRAAVGEAEAFEADDAVARGDAEAGGDGGVGGDFT